MTRESGLAELKDLYSRKDSLSHEEGRAWVERVSELLHRLAPDRAASFDELTPYLFASLSGLTVRPLWNRIGGVVRAAIADRERAELPALATDVPANTTSPRVGEVNDPRTVFVVHGRNESLRQGLFAFLRALGLQPLEWSQAVHTTGTGAPYIGEILDSAFRKAQAVVVLLSPDDKVRLSEALWSFNEPSLERTSQPQARPNVLFEAGMAFGTHPGRTVLVQIGHVKPFSDVAGRHVVRLDNSVETRTDLAQRLERAGCPVDHTGRDWLTAGDFSPPSADTDAALAPTASLQVPLELGKPAPQLDIRLGYLGSWKSEQIIISNVGDGVAKDIVISADGAPIHKERWWVSGQPLPDSLRPGEEFGVKIAPAVDSPERSEIQLTWRSEDGSEYTRQKLLQLI